MSALREVIQRTTDFDVLSCGHRLRATGKRADRRKCAACAQLKHLCALEWSAARRPGRDGDRIRQQIAGMRRQMAAAKRQREIQEANNTAPPSAAGRVSEC